MELARLFGEESQVLFDLGGKGHGTGEFALADLEALRNDIGIDARLPERPFDAEPEVGRAAAKETVRSDRPRQPEWVADIIVADVNAKTKARLENNVATKEGSV